MKNLVNLAILETEDEGKTWTPVEREDVPEELKTDVAMTELVKGNFAGIDGKYYKGVDLTETLKGD